MRALGLAFALILALPLGADAKGATKPSGSLALVMVADANGNGAPNYADTITWSVTITGTPYSPSVFVTCTQAGVTVYTVSAGYWAGYPWSQNMILRSGAWTGGAADCEAVMGYGDGRRFHTLATMRFPVGA